MQMKIGQYFVPSEILPQPCLDIIRDVNAGTAANPSNIKIGLRFVPSEMAKKQTSKSITVKDIHVNDVRSLMLLMLPGYNPRR